MNKGIRKIIFLVIIFSISIVGLTYAHPGNTASDGCHYCRTNCDKWGVGWNVRHCHGGSTYVASKKYITTKKVVLTKDQKCNIKFPGTIYRSTDGRCACPGNIKGSTWNKKTKSCLY